jgi:hypothetical protein
VIYDHAHVSGETLEKGENTASEIFGRAGVSLVWREDFAYALERRNAMIQVPEDPATLIVKLQPDSEAVRYGVPSVCGGIGLGSGAIIFVRSFDSRSSASPATRLGYIIAHEIGHILLGPNAHSVVGIMRGSFRQDDWTQGAQGTLGFTRSQAKQIRRWIATRKRTTVEAQQNPR